MSRATQRCAWCRASGSVENPLLAKFELARGREQTAICADCITLLEQALTARRAVAGSWPRWLLS